MVYAADVAEECVSVNPEVDTADFVTFAVACWPLQQTEQSRSTGIRSALHIVFRIESIALSFPASGDATGEPKLDSVNMANSGLSCCV